MKCHIIMDAYMDNDVDDDKDDGVAYWPTY
jgi:hypothetical protein